MDGFCIHIDVKTVHIDKNNILIDVLTIYDDE